jgi:hypothetical protein
VQLYSANCNALGRSGFHNAEVDRILIGRGTGSRWTPVVALGDAGGRFVLLFWMEDEAPFADSDTDHGERHRAEPAQWVQQHEYSF